MPRVALQLLLAAVFSVVEAAPPGDLRPLDLDGREVAALPEAGGPPTVLVFTRTDCPISNRYAPELRRLHDRFAPTGVRFWLVYPDPGETPAAIRSHAEAYAFGFSALRDPRHGLVRRAGARVTPEVAVYAGGGDGPRLLYRGRIDDRQVAFGKTRPAASSHDLEDILAALARGEPVATRTTTAIGCFIPPLE